MTQLPKQGGHFQLGRVVLPEGRQARRQASTCSTYLVWCQWYGEEGPAFADTSHLSHRWLIYRMWHRVQRSCACDQKDSGGSPLVWQLIRNRHRAGL